MNPRLRARLCGVILLFLALAPAAVRAAPERMTLNFPQTTLGCFLKIVTEKSGMKLITGAELAKKPIAVYLPDVTAEEALESVCKVHDLHWSRQPETGIIVVKETDSEYFSLEHAKAKDVVSLVNTLVGDAGKVSADEQNNVLAVRSGQEGLDKVRKLLAKIDARPAQVLIEATIAEMSDDAQQQLGIRWNVDATVEGAAREAKLPFGRAMVSSLASDTAWSYGVVSFRDFQARLQAIKTDSGVKILANPRLATLDGKDAEIKIVANQVVAQKLTRSEENLGTVIEEPIRADVGVTLRITPRIHPDKEVTLLVEPTVTSASESTFFQESVDTFERSAKTTIRVKDGQTIALGGLLRNEKKETVQKVPVLGDIPLLGGLFTHKVTVERDTDLVVLLTVWLLNEERIAKDVDTQRARVRSRLAGESKKER